MELPRKRDLPLQSIKTKLPGVGTTIFTVMSQLAQEHDAINLSQGFPDFTVPEPLLTLMDKYLRAGYNQYPPMTGVPWLREQSAVKIAGLYEVQVDENDEVTVTSGATEALFVAIQAMVHQGDEVIVLDPAYDAYEPAVTLAGGKTVHISLAAPAFHVDWQRVADAITARTRLIIVNTPHNPCGSIFSAKDLDSLAGIIRNRDICVISDEVYEHMVYDGKSHHSLLTHPELRERSFIISSFGKTYHATGWKVAYCVAPKPLSDEFRKVHQFVTFTTHTPTQWAIAEFMETCPEHYLELLGFYQKKRDLFLEAMEASNFDMIPSEGTYFQLADYRKITDMPDVEFAHYLTTNVGVAVIPVSVFYKSPPNDHIIRFCFAKDDNTLREAAQLLSNLEPL
ncbi:MAG: aminotransferase class I/II-fold pyridoxal phosphate-dependent enzyme [Pseudomonadales bacterium]|nr:aminotransferase class I/II-fold pyridoxal phosphate-dependent enzyme [Pseudomonadales bacterium]